MKFKRSLLFPVFSVLLSFIVLHLLKGSLTSIELVKSNYFFIGNIISILTYILLVFGILLIHIKKNGVENHHKKNIQLFSFIILIPLFVIFLFLQFNISFPGIYLFGLPLEKIVLSSLFILYEFILLFLAFFVWNIYLIRGYRIYLDSSILTVATLAAFYIFVFLYSLNYNEYKKEGIENEKNLAFVLGAAVWQRNEPSPIFKGRIEKSYELYSKGIISKIQVTGSNAPGELSEAKTAYNYLLSKGVDTSDVLLEENSSNTHQQIQFLMKNESVYRKNFNNIILISDEFHMVRILELCKYYDLKVVTVTSDYKLNWEKLLYYRVRESVALFLFWLFGI